MKLKFNLNTENPEQHMAIMVIVGVFMAMNIISMLRSSSSGPENELPLRTPGTFAETGVPLYINPQMSWWEKMFCRGFHRAQFCSNRLLHPLKPVLEAEGVVIEEGPVPHTEVVDYRGPLPKTRAIAGRVKMENYLGDTPPVFGE